MVMHLVQPLADFADGSSRRGRRLDEHELRLLRHVALNGPVTVLPPSAGCGVTAAALAADGVLQRSPVEPQGNIAAARTGWTVTDAGRRLLARLVVVGDAAPPACQDPAGQDAGPTAGVTGTRGSR